MKREYATPEATTEVLKQAVWLAWQAAGGPIGNGYIEDEPGADREAVWRYASTDGYYFLREVTDRVEADYVFGRMLKLLVRRPTPTTIEYPDVALTRDAQAWSNWYPTYTALFDAAERVL